MAGRDGLWLVMLRAQTTPTAGGPAGGIKQRPSPMSSTISLQAGDLTLTVAPGMGGAITSFRVGDFDLMRPALPEAFSENNARRASSYPLVPFSNRIANGRFSFGGQDYAVTLGINNNPHAIHGNGLSQAWAVVDQDEASCIVELTNAATIDWPFAYLARQHFRLDDTGLTMQLVLENRDGRTMPAGFGWHPFFNKRPGTQVRFGAEAVWINSAEMLPTQRIALPPDWDFGKRRLLTDTIVDNCFAGWDGHAEIWHQPEGVRLTISADPIFGHLVFFVPPGRNDFAVEPVTHMNNAINHLHDVRDHGLHLLPSGTALEGTVRFSVDLD